MITEKTEVLWDCEAELIWLKPIIDTFEINVEGELMENKGILQARQLIFWKKEFAMVMLLITW